MAMSQYHNAGRSHYIKIDNSSFERAKYCKYLGKTLAYQNSIQAEIKSWLKWGKAYCLSVRNILSSSLLSKNMKIKTYRNKIFPLVLYWCETWSLTLREERRLRVFENRVLRRILRPKRDEVTGEWKKLHNELNDLSPSPNIIRVIELRRTRWAGQVERMGWGEVHTGLGEWY